ncbi:MAG: D-alanine--D-alanine ligase [Magnetococcales bacterium]|nr:D-alanine--D-alanine ligase [Magnetococcales bacterium]
MRDNKWRQAKVGVLLGGLSEEREVSLRSGKAMATALRRQGFDVTEIDVARDLPARLVASGIQVAVLALHGPYGEDGTVQGLLEILGIPYTGSGVASSANCMDKGLCKRLLRDQGLPTPPWVICRGRLAPDSDETTRRSEARRLAEEVRAAGLRYPLFVKPHRSGSSVGIARVATFEELAGGLAGALAVSAEILVEQGVIGREVTLSVFDGQGLPLVGILPSDTFFDYHCKYTAGRTRYPIPPPDLDEETMAEATRLGVAAYECAGCRGLARVDLMIDADNKPWILEINTIPGMTETSLAPKAAAHAGLSFDALVERILAGATLEQCGAGC